MIDVVAGLFSKDGRYLVARRRQTAPNAGTWEFPGGKIEPGESPEQALRREIMEELGTDCEVGELFVVTLDGYQSRPIRLWVFRGTLSDTDVCLREHEQAVWLLPEEMVGLAFSEADVPVATLLRCEAP